MAISSEMRQQIREVAEQVRRKFYGGRGPPLSGAILFEELEDQAAELGDAVACEIMQQVLQQQADVDHPTTTCEYSVCARSGELDDVQPRVVQTRRGTVTWREPRCLCKRCRKAFFLSDEGLGDGRRRERQPRHPQENGLRGQSRGVPESQ